MAHAVTMGRGWSSLGRWLSVLAGLGLATVAQAQVTVTNGLVAYWSFDGHYLDSIKDFHGTPRGTEPIPFVQGKAGFGQSIKLNGEDQFVEITGGNENELEFPGGSMSIAGWFKVDNFDTDWQALISKGEGTNYRVARRSATGSIAYAGGVGEAPEAAPEVNDGEWHHFVAISDHTGGNPNGSGTELWVDGVLWEINYELPVLDQSDFNLMIGENPGARGREWEGEIDDMAIWNRVLTAEEIEFLYNNGNGRAISSLLPEREQVIYVLSVDHTTRSFTFVVSDLGDSVVDPDSATLTIDGQAAAVTHSKEGDLTTFVHERSSRWEAGSEHTYVITVSDEDGNEVTREGTFSFPMPWFPRENLPSGPIPDGAWAVRHIFGAGTIGDLTTAMNLVATAGSDDFEGVYVDTTSQVINYPESGGFFADGLPYPDEVQFHESGLWTGEDFIQLAVGNIVVPEEGEYTFGVHSDDGFALRIRGAEAVAVYGNGSFDPVDPEAIVHPNTTGDSNTRAVYHLRKGIYRVEFFWYERGGGDNGELYAAPGHHSSDAATDEWMLVGDPRPSETFNKPGVDENGWTVIASDRYEFELNNYFDALALLEASGGQPTQYDALFVGDPDTNAGVAPFPKDTPGDDDDFAMRATATLVVPVAGTYEIGFTSDDGGWMRMPGQVFTEIIKNATGVSYLESDDTVVADVLTGNSLTTVSVQLTAGNHPIEIGSFERGGGAFIRGIAAELGSWFLPTITRGGAGEFRTPTALQLTNEDPGTSDPVSVTITRSGNELTIEWSPAGGTLEFSPVLGPGANWTEVGTANPTQVGIGPDDGFYRIRQ